MLCGRVRLDDVFLLYWELIEVHRAYEGFPSTTDGWNGIIRSFVLARFGLAKKTTAGGSGGGDGMIARHGSGQYVFPN